VTEKIAGITFRQVLEADGHGVGHRDRFTAGLDKTLRNALQESADAGLGEKFGRRKERPDRISFI
jgi:hypothetical protein